MKLIFWGQINEATWILHVIKFPRVYVIRDIFNEKFLNDVISHILNMIVIGQLDNIFTRSNKSTFITACIYAQYIATLAVLNRVNRDFAA